MNDTDRGGMTVSSLLVMGLTASVVIPVIAIIVLGILIKNVADQTVVVYMVGVCALIVLLGVLLVNYFVRRRILDRVQGLVDVCRKYATGDHSVRALVIGDDEFAMLAMSLNTLFDNQGFSSGGTAAAASNSSDAAALQAQIEKLLQEVSAVGDGDLRLFVGCLVFGGDVQDSVGVDVEDDFDLRNAARRRRKASEVKAPQALVV